MVSSGTLRAGESDRSQGPSRLVPAITDEASTEDADGFASGGARRERGGGALCPQDREEVVTVAGTSHDPAGQAASVPVALAASRVEAELIAGMLRSNGVRAVVSADDAGGLEPQLQMQGVRVLVAPSDEASAHRLLAANDTQD